MPTWDKDARRHYRAGQKYKKVVGDKWIIDTSKDHGSVRPIDLVSRDPDRLREFDSKEAAVAFEEECYKEAERLKAAGEDWSQYRYIPRKQLNIPEDQRQLHDSLVGETRDGNRDVTDVAHARDDELREELSEMRAEVRAGLAGEKLQGKGKSDKEPQSPDKHDDKPFKQVAKLKLKEAIEKLSTSASQSSDPQRICRRLRGKQPPRIFERPDPLSVHSGRTTPRTCFDIGFGAGSSSETLVPSPTPPRKVLEPMSANMDSRIKEVGDATSSSPSSKSHGGTQTTAGALTDEQNFAASLQ